MFFLKELSKRRYGTGSVLRCLAILLILLSPMMNSVHITEFRHLHSTVTGYEPSSSGHDSRCHEPNYAGCHLNQASIVIEQHSSRGKEHDPHHCSFCRIIRVLDIPFTLLAQPSVLSPVTADKIFLPELKVTLLSHFSHFSHSRAPPSA